VINIANENKTINKIIECFICGYQEFGLMIGVIT